MISVHTSPLAQPGTGDAGGMNVYVVETAKQLAERGIEVEIFTRTTTHELDPVTDLAPGVQVRHVTAGPYEGLRKEDLPGQLCAFAAGVMRTVAHAPPGYYDLAHSHYWLSGQVGWLAADRWQVPLVHSMHTMARVKNSHLAEGDSPEPPGREIGEVQVIEAADRLVANTDQEARELIELYAADPAKVAVVPPGVDLTVFSPGDRAKARAEVGVPQDDLLLLFVGRIQPLKAPDVLVRAAAELVRRHPEWRDRLRVAVLGGMSGSGLAHPESLRNLVADLGLTDTVTVAPPVSREELAAWYRAADAVAVPSYSESFGLVAIEAQASGAAVVAADVGGLPTAVGDAGILVDGHETSDWADALGGVVSDPALRDDLGRRGVEHASRFGWPRTVDRLLEVYAEAVAERRANNGGDVGAPRFGSVPSAVVP
jgi:D-inositol-3-phosphate glycosyltransferase